MEMKVSQITQNDRNFLDVAEDMAREIVHAYIPGHSGPITPKELDETFRGWLENPKSYEANVIANSLGAAFGACMNRELGTKWVLVTDQYGTALAVWRENPSWTTFPFDAVRKRIKSRESAFFQSIVGVARMQLNKQ